MRKKQIFVLLIVLVFLNIASFSMIIYTRADDSIKSEIPSLPLEKDAALDGTQKYKNLVVDGAVADTGNQWDVLVNDDSTGEFYYQAFECIVYGTHCNIWVGMNSTYDSYDNNGTPEIEDDIWYFSYPWSSEGYIDSDYPGGYYLYPNYVDYITGEQLIYLANEFDNEIHKKVTDWFGMYNTSRPGPLEDGKIQILVFNIRDEFFYSPTTAQGYIAGYFWGYVSELNDANIFHMDTYQWWRRVGDDPEMPEPYDDPVWWPPYPNQYEATLAHEFQHLINYDVDRDEVSWVDEGCSTLAEWVCGYGFTSNIFWYMAYWWDTSLVIWNNFLENYGVVFLWTYYCYEHYGGKKLIWDLAHEQANGIEGWTNALRKNRVWKSFDMIFQEWAIANYLDDTRGAHGVYGYYGLEMGSADTGGWDIPYSIWYWEAAYPGSFDTQVDTYPALGYNYPYASQLPYVVNYVEFYDASPILEIDFNGADYIETVSAYSGSYEWCSDGTSWSWFRMGQSFDIPLDVDTYLTFWTYYEIESDWDYGYVEVHDVTTDEWFTLPGLLTTHALPNAQDNPYCPHEAEPYYYYYYLGIWNAFTGYSPGWYQESMDLTRFAGHTIDLYFTYWTDGYFQEIGWYIDDIEITDILFDNVEEGENGWIVDSGWFITDGLILNDFRVSIIQIMNFYNRKGEFIRDWHFVYPQWVDEETEEATIRLWMPSADRIETYAVMVVANQPGYEHTFASYYTFTANIGELPWWFGCPKHHGNRYNRCKC